MKIGRGRRARLNAFLQSGLTMWSFIKYRLHVHSAAHSKRVRNYLKQDINELARKGEVRPAKSVRGKRTYIRVAA